jgi:D-glycero-alpha-D-manno-heptose-7-phosphate kinase
MIISQTPLRMSLAGGGSDLPAFYRRHGGAVVSTAIDKSVYVGVNAKFDNAIRISYSKTEEVSAVRDIEHPLVREILLHLGIEGGIEITSMADIPSRGTGLGSSSSFTVGLLHALYAYKNRYVSPEQLGAESCHIEIGRCGDRIGKQDQYAAAFGGLNFIRFEPDDSVTVTPILCDPQFLDRLQNSIIVFYTGLTRTAKIILDHQSDAMENDSNKRKLVQGMVSLAYDLRNELHRNNLEAVGEILHAGWMMKRELMLDISNPQIDVWYDRARLAGSSGGKLLGAGAGGFLAFCAPPDKHAAIAAAIPELRRVPMRFEPRGSRVILYQPNALSSFAADQTGDSPAPHIDNQPPTHTGYHPKEGTATTHASV